MYNISPTWRRVQQYGTAIRLYSSKTASARSSRWRRLGSNLASFCVPVAVGVSVGYGLRELQILVLANTVPAERAKIKISQGIERSTERPAADQYEYDHLPDGYIRLVTVKPGQKGDTIELELRNVRFESTASWWIPRDLKLFPKYAALSYQWGDTKNERFVTVNEKPFKVTRNLYGALQLLQEMSFPLPIWIDAISLDQADTEEKDRQLNLMGQIYANAHGVIVWLGEDDNSVDLSAGANLISRISQEILKLQDSEIFNKDVTDPTGLKKADYWTAAEYEEGWKAIKNILDRGYWSRSWILQETILAKIRQMFIGRQDVTGIVAVVELLDKFPELEGQIRADLLNSPEVIPRISELIQAMTQHPTAWKREFKLFGKHKFFGLSPTIGLSLPGLPMGKLMTDFRGKKSTMPQDQVYSLLGTTFKQNSQPFPKFDAGQSLSKLFADTTRYIIAQDGDLGILRQNNTHRRNTTPGWPSWVPDWSASLPGSGSPLSQNWHPHKWFPPDKYDFRFDGDALIIQGHILSTIKSKTKTVNEDGTGEEEPWVPGTLKFDWSPRENLRMSQKYGHGFLPVTIYQDSDANEIRGPPDVKAGDVIVIAGKGPDPLILRPKENGEYELIGTGYMPEIRKNGAFWMDRWKEMKWDVKEMEIR